MSEIRLDKMRASREIPEVTLQKYNQLRSKCPSEMIFAFEGEDDVTFYEVMFDRINSDIKFVPLVCKGKDKVLNLKALLSRNFSHNEHLVKYFIDFDFDGYKGYVPSLDIYCTSAYSFENFLVSKEILRSLLRAEYRCNDENGAAEIDNICALFDSRLNEFINCMYEKNHLLFYARRAGMRLGSIDDDYKKYINVGLDMVSFGSEANNSYKLLGFPEVPDAELVRLSEDAFKKLDPVMEWRGKFIYYFFTKLLSHLKDDRGTKTPRYFSERKKMSFSPLNDIIRSLTSMAPIPECLVEFSKSIRLDAAQ